MSGYQKNHSRYPAEWKAISAAVLELANHTCQGSPSYPACSARNGIAHPVTGSRVILTVAHLDQIRTPGPRGAPLPHGVAVVGWGTGPIRVGKIADAACLHGN
jgi:hypothetical protein